MVRPRVGMAGPSDRAPISLAMARQRWPDRERRLGPRPQHRLGGDGAAQPHRVTPRPSQRRGRRRRRPRRRRRRRWCRRRRRSGWGSIETSPSSLDQRGASLAERDQQPRTEAVAPAGQRRQVIARRRAGPRPRAMMANSVSLGMIQSLTAASSGEIAAPGAGLRMVVAPRCPSGLEAGAWSRPGRSRTGR